MRKKLIIANWKMNHGVEDTLKFLTHYKGKVRTTGAVQVVLCAPFTSLYAASIYLAEIESPVLLGAQNCHWEDTGAYTGEISAQFLKEMSCQFVIVGHSERRHLFGETSEQVAQKAKTVLNKALSPVFCVGEKKEEREAGKTETVILSQLEALFKKNEPQSAEKLVIAYEPVWAIGTGLSASPEQAQEVHFFIRNKIKDWAGEKLANQLQILYGGSVSPANIKALLAKPDIDGALVGSASLGIDSFLQIVHDAAAV